MNYDIIKGRLKKFYRFVPIDLTSKLSSMDNFMIFEPFPEKIEESCFSILRVKGRGLKLENSEYLDL